jgi:hypothetical protein
MTPAAIRVNVGMILPKLLGGALAAALLFAPAAGAAVLDPVDGVHVAAQDGLRLWNHVDSGLRYSLVDDAGDTLADAPSPFDVSLGTDGEGRVQAMYSRCANGDQCRLYAYDIEAQSERALGITGRSPSLSDGVLAFARGKSVYQSRLGVKPRVIARVKGRGTFVAAVAASERGVAFVSRNESTGTAMYLKPAGGGKLRRLSFTRFGDGRENLSPVWFDGRLYWVLAEDSFDSGWVMRYSPGGRVVAAPVTGKPDSVALDGGTLITSAALDDDGAGQVATLDSPLWGTAPPDAGIGR